MYIIDVYKLYKKYTKCQHFTYGREDIDRKRQYKMIVHIHI